MEELSTLTFSKKIKSGAAQGADPYPEMTAREIERDLKLCKQFNIDTVRTSHYTPDPLLIELAAELGIEEITKWLGFISQEEAAAEWANMDIAIVPSVTDSDVKKYLPLLSIETPFRGFRLRAE